MTANSPHILSGQIRHNQPSNQKSSNTYQTMNFEQLGKGNKHAHKKGQFLGWECSWISQPKIIVFHKTANLTGEFIVEKHWPAIVCGTAFTRLQLQLYHNECNSVTRKTARMWYFPRNTSSFIDVWLKIWILRCSVVDIISLSCLRVIYICTLTWLLLLGVQMKVTSSFPSLNNCTQQ